MNLQEFCKERGVSRPTVYKRIREAGIDLDSLRDAAGSLTPEAITTLAALLDNTQSKHGKRNNLSPETATIDAAENPVKIANLLTEINELKVKLTEAQEQLQAANSRIMELQQQAVDREREHAQAWQQFSERQQEIEARKLLAATAGADGRSIWQRLRAAFKTDK